MHDCLKPAYIRTLPSLQQAEALRAFNGPYPVITAFARKYAGTRPGPDGLGRVPVYYRALQHPPNLADPVEPESRLAAAHFSLVAISRLFNSVDIIVPIGALESLWLRIWPWIQYIQAGHHTHPRDPHDAAESALCVSLILFFWSEPKHHPVLHPHVEGVTTIFGSASQQVVLATPPHAYEADLDRICAGLAALFVPAEPQMASQLLRDLIDGLGGPRSLALLIASLLTRICPRLDVSPAPINIQSVGRIIEFLGATTSTGGASDEGFTQALGQRRPITAMTNALRSLTLTPTSTNAVAAPFRLLLHLLTITPSSGLRRSLQSGLLTAVFACGRRHMATTRQFLFQFFTNVLSPATVFHSVLLQLKSHRMPSSPQTRLLSAVTVTCTTLGEPSAACYHFGSIWSTPNDPGPATTQIVLALLPTLISNVVQNAQFRAIVLEHVSAKPGTGNTASFANCSAFVTDRPS
ncbi:hypothetical protein B0H14DRAFT_3467818 [Mycena olivaceomarginata]|nr:hypothetical protein B0H14DRAFT_3467818 [Mycena olivaceomarginata]